MIAMVRAKVEHPFRVIKHQFGHVKTRYRGLAKNRAQLFTLFALGNLFRSTEPPLSATRTLSPARQSGPTATSASPNALIRLSIDYGGTGII